MRLRDNAFSIGQYGLVAWRIIAHDHVGQNALGHVYEAHCELSGALLQLTYVDKALQEDPNAFVERARSVEAAAPELGHAYVGARTLGADRLLHLAVSKARWMDELVREDGPLPESEVRELGRSAADCLSVSHAMERVHGDLDPSRVLRLTTPDQYPSPGIVSFPADRVCNAPLERFRTPPYAIRNPRYACPELVRGEPLDSRADIYGLGLVLFTAATGQPPFDGASDPGIAMHHVKTPAPAPSSVASGAVSPELDEVILRCLAKSPDERFASMAELRGALG